MKNTWLWIIGVGALLYFFIMRRPAAKPNPTATAGTAGSQWAFSDLFKGIPTGNVNDNTPQLVNAATNAFGTVFKGIQSLWKTGQSTPSSAGTIGNAAPIDVSSPSVSSWDLGENYWPAYSSDYLNSGYWDSWA